VIASVALKTLLAATALAVLPLAASAAGDAEAPDQNLRIQHHVMTIGKDGVQRESRYADLMFRRADTVWIERELPPALRADHDHEASEGKVHIGHSHADNTAAPLWLRRDAAGKVQVGMVLRQQRKLIEVDKANYGNVGYGGSWANAYWLVDPASLPHMKALGTAGNKGVQRYEVQQGESTLRIDWDVAGRYARKIEQRNAHGTSLNVMTASAIPAPKTLPWQIADAYERGEYSDLLD
jgi:opacity protein-like surface antigen